MTTDTEPRHTPGPWRIGTHKEASEAGTTNLPVWGPDGQATCWVEDRGGETRDNARLIAAAPAMLAALVRMLDQAEGCWQHHYGENPEGGPVPEHIAMARAAIASASPCGQSKLDVC